MTNSRASTTAKRTLALLFLVSFFNYLDRYVLSVLLPSIKAELDLSDTLLGSISTAFTISYVVFGIPLARAADQFSRKKVISMSLALWSAMTVACGLAQNFIQLAVARVMVGIGEAGATPSAHSLISDLFPQEKRAMAIGWYSIGAPVGILVGFTIGGWLVQHYSWRLVFLSFGLPGILLATYIFLRLKEPKRGQSDRPDLVAEADESPSLLQVLRSLWSSAAYRHLCIATGLYTVVWLGVVSWLPSYFVRSFDMNIAQVGFLLAMSLGISQLIGMLCAGLLTDFMVKRDVRWYGWIAAIAMFVSTPIFVAVFLTNNATVAMSALFLAFLVGIFQGPSSLAAVQTLAHLRMRAMAAAVFFLIVNLIGGAIGPLLTGWLSDALRPTYGDDSLRYALLSVALIFGMWAGVHYALSTRTIRKEVSAR
jgi:MFS family permease